MPSVVRFEAWSDYLCPWCWNASRRLEAVASEFAGQIEIVWRSYLLRPVERSGRDTEKFRRYTEGWRVPGSEPDAGAFRPWASDAPPPSHSVPAHRAAKAAAELGREAFDAIHDRLMTAYFAENRDVSNFDVLREIWGEAGLPGAAFDVAFETRIEEAVHRDHAAAQALGATGVPAIRRVDNDALIVGAQPIDVYRRWVTRSLERGEGLVEV